MSNRPANPEHNDKEAMAWDIIRGFARRDRITWNTVPSPFAPVQVRRTSGSIESGWEVIGRNERGELLVWNYPLGRMDCKVLPYANVLELNPDLLLDQPQASLEDKRVRTAADRLLGQQRENDVRPLPAETTLIQLRDDVSDELAQRLDLRFPVVSGQILDLIVEAGREGGRETFQDADHMKLRAQEIVSRRMAAGQNPFQNLNRKDMAEITAMVGELIGRKCVEVSDPEALLKDKAALERILNPQDIVAAALRKWLENIINRWVRSN